MKKKTPTEAYKAFFSKEKNAPIYCDVSEFSEKEQKMLEHSSFCILPWIHIHGYPNGQAYPCCDSVYEYPVGDLNVNSIETIMNNDSMKQMRVNMMSDKPCRECSKCYEAEKHGFKSLRNSFNKRFSHHLPEVLKHTSEDGTITDFKMRYFDIRFSNLCNLKCRTCGDIFSSAWAQEDAKRFGKKAPPIIRVGKTESDIMDQIEKHIPYMEQMYFAGGEPLMMEEHYTIIHELLKRKMYHVMITYNTNFTRLEYGEYDLLNMWKKFKWVSVGASLDAEGARAEYMRSGTQWDKIVENRRRMLKVCPNVGFYINATISLMNVIHIPDFHRHWVEEGLIKPHEWNNNILQHPTDRRVDVLPKPYKDIAIEKIRKHIEWLGSVKNDPGVFPDNITNVIIPSYESIITMMESNDRSNELATFFGINRRLDKYRGETFEQAFPEYKDLITYAI